MKLKLELDVTQKQLKMFQKEVKNSKAMRLFLFNKNGKHHTLFEFGKGKLLN